MLKRIANGALIEIGALAVLGVGVYIASSAALGTSLTGIIGLACLSAWSGLTVLATLVAFDLLES